MDTEISPDDDLQRRVIALVKRVKADGTVDVRRDTALLVELDSLRIVELLDAIHAEFEIDLSREEQLAEFLVTPRAIAAAVQMRMRPPAI